MNDDDRFSRPISIPPSQLDVMLEWPSLGPLLRERVSSCDGRWVVLAPPEASPERLREISTGGLWRGTSEHPKPKEWLAGVLLDVAADPPEFGLVLSNAIGIPGSRGLERARARLLYRGDEVYHVFDGPLPSRSDLVYELRLTATLPYSFGACGSARLPDVDATQSDMEHFASQASLVYIHAFDGESYFVWREAAGA